MKLTNIVLTPSKPKYSGGRWHTEGVKDVENIVASGLYYYSMNNISPSFLALGRIPARSYYDEECEELCQIESIEGRCVAFTNDLLHRAKPFQVTFQLYFLEVLWNLGIAFVWSWCISVA